MPLTIPVASEQVFGSDTTGPGRAAAAVQAACRAGRVIGTAPGDRAEGAVLQVELGLKVIVAQLADVRAVACHRSRTAGRITRASP